MHRDSIKSYLLCSAMLCAVSARGESRGFDPEVAFETPTGETFLRLVGQPDSFGEVDDAERRAFRGRCLFAIDPNPVALRFAFGRRAPVDDFLIGTGLIGTGLIGPPGAENPIAKHGRTRRVALEMRWECAKQRSVRLGYELISSTPAPSIVAVSEQQVDTRPRPLGGVEWAFSRKWSALCGAGPRAKLSRKPCGVIRRESSDGRHTIFFSVAARF